MSEPLNIEALEMAAIELRGTAIAKGAGKDATDVRAAAELLNQGALELKRLRAEREQIVRSWQLELGCVANVITYASELESFPWLRGIARRLRTLCESSAAHTDAFGKSAMARARQRPLAEFLDDHNALNVDPRTEALVVFDRKGELHTLTGGTIVRAASHAE